MRRTGSTTLLVALIASLLAIPVAAPAATEIVVDPTDVDCDNDTGPVYCVG